MFTQSEDKYWEIFDAFNTDTQRNTTSPTSDVVAKGRNGESGSENSMETITHICSYCQNSDFIFEDGLCCCKQCGGISEDVLMHSKEHSFSSDKSKQVVRVGMPENPLLPSSSLGSVISARGKYMPAMKKMCQYHKWNSMPYKERSLWNVYNKIMEKAHRGGISNALIDEAKSIYKNLSEVNISRGSNRNGLIAACVYVSCKRNNVPRSVKEIAHMFNLTVPELTKGAKKLHEVMNLCRKQIHHTKNVSSSANTNAKRDSHKKNDSNESKKEKTEFDVDLSSITVKTTNAGDFMERFCSSLNMAPEIIQLCIRVADAATDLGIVDENTPPSIASGCIFLVIQVMPSIKNSISKKSISLSCNISEVTIGKCLKKLFPYRTYLFTKEDIDRFGIVL